jgi:iron complex transport system permease protein
VVVVALVALGLAVVLSVAIGSALLSPAQVWHALASPTGLESDIVVRELRIPRTLLSILVGVALGVAGALMQGHTRNPLADPGLLGVSGGAGFVLVLGITLLGITDLSVSVWFAFFGAGSASMLVFALGALGRGGPTPVTMALAGVAVSELLIAVTSALVIGDGTSLDAYRFWSAGALDDRGAGVVGQVAPFVLAGLVLAALNAPALDVLALGEDTARGLGQHVGRARAIGVVAVTLLAGSAVAVSGPIGFVGLVAPHVVRSLTGPEHRWLLPLSGVVGATLVLLADVVGRVVVRPGELQVGIVLGVLGAPFFIALVRRRTVRL